MPERDATTGEEQPPALDPRWVERVSRWVTAPEENAAFEAFRVRASHAKTKFVLWPKSAREAKGYSMALAGIAMIVLFVGMGLDENRLLFVAFVIGAAQMLLDRWIGESASITAPNSVVEAVRPGRPATQVLLDLHQAGIKGSALAEAIFLQGMTSRKHEGALVAVIMAFPVAMVAGGIWQSGGQDIGFWAWLLLLLLNGLAWFFLVGGPLREAVVAWNAEVTMVRAFRWRGAMGLWRPVTPRIMWDVISLSVVLLLVFALQLYPLASWASRAGWLQDYWPSVVAFVGYLLVFPPALCLLARWNAERWRSHFESAAARADREFDLWALDQHEFTSGD